MFKHRCLFQSSEVFSFKSPLSEQVSVDSAQTRMYPRQETPWHQSLQQESTPFMVIEGGAQPIMQLAQDLWSLSQPLAKLSNLPKFWWDKWGRWQGGHVSNYIVGRATVDWWGHGGEGVSSRDELGMAVLEWKDLLRDDVWLQVEKMKMGCEQGQIESWRDWFWDQKLMPFTTFYERFSDSKCSA